MRNTGGQRKRDPITSELGVINLVRLQRAVTLFSVVGDHVHIQGIVLPDKGTEAVTLFFKLGFGGKGDGLRVGAAGGGCSFRPNPHNTGACWKKPREWLLGCYHPHEYWAFGGWLLACGSWP